MYQRKHYDTRTGSYYAADDDSEERKLSANLRLSSASALNVPARRALGALVLLVCIAFFSYLVFGSGQSAASEREARKVAYRSSMKMSFTGDGPIKRRFLVTGGSGLVGRAVLHIVEQEAPKDEQWTFVSSKDADLLDEKQTYDLVNHHRPTHILHLAAMVGGLYKNMAENVQMYVKNERMNENVLEAALKVAKEEGKKIKVCSCLSTCVFPANITEYPITEEQLHKGLPHSSNMGYAMAKRNVDVLNRLYVSSYPDYAEFTSVMPTNVFGPHDNFDRSASHVLPSLIRKAAELEKEEKMKVFGSGKPRRQFIYSRDLARLLLWVMREYGQVEPLILSVSPEEEVTIADAAGMVMRAFDRSAEEIEFDTSKSDGQMKKTVSIERLQREYKKNTGNFFEFTPLEAAIRETVDWFKENVDEARL